MKKPLSAIGLVVGLVLFAMSGTIARAEISPYYGAPLCPTHDDRAYHGLWDDVRGCHYDHHHGGNPHALDDKFGTELFSLMGGEISHPWQTFSAAGTENELKHHGYYWITLEDLPCTASNRITDVRALVHQHAQLDFPVRDHSMVMEVRGCDAATGPWYALVGGWHDSGDGLVNGQIVFDVANDGNLEKQHRSGNRTQVWYTCLKFGEHVLNNCIARASLSIHDAWSSTTSTGQEGAYFCYPSAQCRFNATTLRSHLMAVSIVPGLADALGCDQPCNQTGYATRYGVPVSGCALPGLDCVPMRFENFHTGETYVCDAVCAQIFSDHDIYFCGTTLCTATTPGAWPSGWQEPHH